MKTTIEISDPLFERSRRMAQREGTTLRALVEEGLRLALAARAAKPAAPFTLPAFGEGGRTEAFATAQWPQLRAAIYGGPDNGAS